jgi:HAMP domain-containing protein
VTLRARTLLMVTALLVIAVLASATVLTWTGRQALLVEAETQARLLARLLANSARFASDVTTEVDGAIGEQMIVEATILAHLVALAEAARVPPERINAHLRAIARDTVLNEFWITDEKGHAYLRNRTDVDFTFSPDPKQQPQAHIFWPLLTGQRRTVVQEARQREVDTQIFKYAGVSGVDKPRIVQVGYRAEFLERLRNKIGLSRLVEDLVAGRNVIAMRVVDKTIVTLVYSAVPGQSVPPELGEEEKAELREVIDEGQTRSFLHGDVLTVMAPIMGDRGDRALAATVVRLPADRLREAIRRNLKLAGVVAAGVLAVGLLASVILARRVTGPVSRLTAAAAALESHTFEPESLADVTRRRDELGHLARVFHRMALEVYAREQRLRQEVQQLRIEIDDAKKVRQVAEITETEYFQDLRQRAQGLRARFEGPTGSL